MENFIKAKIIMIDTIESYSSMDAGALYRMCDKFIEGFTDAKTRTFKNISVESLKNLLGTVDSAMSFANAMYYIDSIINVEIDTIILEKVETLEDDRKFFEGDEDVMKYIDSFKNFNGFLKYTIDRVEF